MRYDFPEPSLDPEARCYHPQGYPAPAFADTTDAGRGEPYTDLLCLGCGCTFGALEPDNDCPDCGGETEEMP